MYTYGFYGFDYTYFWFMLPAIIISMWAQVKVKTTFKKYSQIRNSRGITGADAAYRVLSYNNVMGVQIQRTPGSLTDNFNPQDKTINLSDSPVKMRRISSSRCFFASLSSGLRGYWDFRTSGRGSS